jgi:hypothetical protein
MNYKVKLFETKPITVVYNEVIGIDFFSDMHEDTANFCESSWNRFMLGCIERKDRMSNYFVFGLGDYNDFLSTSENRKIQNSELHESTSAKLSKLVDADVKSVCKRLDPIKENIVGLSEGNHTWIYPNGKTSTESMCSRLGCEYLEYLFVVKIPIVCTSGARSSIIICGVHGKYSGKRAGATINGLEDLASIFMDADIYVMGHDHQRGAVPSSVLTLNGNEFKIKEHVRYYARTGSFARGYQNGVSNYVVRRLLKPSNLGGLRFNITFDRKTEDGDRILKKHIEAII